MTFKLGLTGSIGMGKSTTANMFETQGCAVWDADAAVHRLYAKGGAAVGPVGATFPQVLEHGAISRQKLRQLVVAAPDLLAQVEAIVHPLVAQDRTEFVQNTTAQITVFDIPLLFETGADAEMDATVCVTVSPDIQKDRVLARGTMTQDEFVAIVEKQMPDSEKKRRADYVIETTDRSQAEAQVADVIQAIQDKISNA